MNRRLAATLAAAVAALGGVGACGGNSACPDGSDCGSEQPREQCEPPCGGETPVCDGGTRLCVTCTAAEGCGTGEVCDTTVAGGACVGCLSEMDCADSAKPVCDVASHECVTCTATAGCAPGDVCDTSVTGGACVGCLLGLDCADSATPVCDLAIHECVTCTATGGCAPGDVCDTSVAGGACVGCRSGLDCADGAKPVCDLSIHECVTCTATGGCAPGDVCDTSIAGGACVGCRSGLDCADSATPVCDLAIHECVTCTATGGCAPDHVCDTSIAGGACVDCLSGLDCADSTTPVCDPSRHACVTCTADAGCSANSVCDTSTTGGACVGCLSAGDCSDSTKPVCDLEIHACVTCTADEGCDADEVCDTSVTGGACVGCRSPSDCKNPLQPLCDDTTHACVTCTVSAGCDADEVCDTSVTGGACVGCRSPSDCKNPLQPLCDDATHACVTCTASTGCDADEVCDTNVTGGACVGCRSAADCSDNAKPVCDLDAHECVTCTASAGCDADEVCDTSVTGGACVGCRSAADCGDDAKPVCNLDTHECVTCTASAGCAPGMICNTAVPGGACAPRPCASHSDCADPLAPFCDSVACRSPTASESSGQIGAARAASGTVSLPLHWVTVTYLKPAAGNEGPGFFIQSEKTGPALYVDGTTAEPLLPGDLVNLRATYVSTVNGLKQVTAFAGLTKVGRSVDVATLVQDVSAVDVVTNLATFESELIAMTGTIAGDFVELGVGHVGAPVTTAGVGAATASLRLRITPALQAAFELEPGCSFTLGAGPMWRHFAGAQPSAYRGGDFSQLLCAAPTVIAAVATSSTEVRIELSRQILGASVIAGGGQFTIIDDLKQPLAVTAAAVSGSTITLTTAVQQLGATYTVSIANTVTDLIGTGIGSPYSASFLAHDTPAVLLISEVNPFAADGDLIELVVVAPGSMRAVQLWIEGRSFPSVVVFPPIDAIEGDIFVVHAAAGASEATTKGENTCAACYPDAWDIFSTDADVADSEPQLVSVGDTLTGYVHDAVPLFAGTTASSELLDALDMTIAAGEWEPCASSPCTSDEARLISVLWEGVTSAESTSIARDGRTDTNGHTDWRTPGRSSFGAANCSGAECVPPPCASNDDCLALTPICGAGGVCRAPTAAESSAQIQAVRAASGVVELPVQGVIVTKVKEQVGAEGPGFFVQAEQLGPALYVSSSVPVQPGDRVSFTASYVERVSGVLQVTSMSSFVRLAASVDVGALRQELSAINLAGMLADLESELIALDATVAGDFTAAGTAHVAATFTTAGMPAADTSVRLRMPQALRDDLDLVSSCTLTVRSGIMWRYNATAQPSVLAATDLTNVVCPAPMVHRAFADSSTSITVELDRQILAASVDPSGSQFEIRTTETSVALGVSGVIAIDGARITLATEAQVQDLSYTVTVADTVTDRAGRGVSTPNTAAFTGYRPVAGLLITEVNPNMAYGADLIELLVTTGGSTYGAQLWIEGATNPPIVSLPTLEVTAGDVIVIHAEAGTTETTAKNENPCAVCYPNAWDLFLIPATISSAAPRLLTVRDTLHDVVSDALPLWAGAAASAQFLGALDAVIAAGQWQACATSACTSASAQAVSVSSDGVGADATTSARRRGTTGTTDTNSRTDFRVGAATFGAVP